MVTAQPNPAKKKPRLEDKDRLDRMVAAIIANPSAYPKLTTQALVATACLVLSEIDERF